MAFANISDRGRVRRTERCNSNSRIVMKRAWSMAHRAQALFGGRAPQYLAQALRFAWAERNADPLVIECRSIIADIRARKAGTGPKAPRLSPGLLAAAARRRGHLGSYVAHAW